MIKEKRLKYIVFCLLNMTGIFAFVGQVAAQAIVGCKKNNRNMSCTQILF